MTPAKRANGDGVTTLGDRLAANWVMEAVHGPSWPAGLGYAGRGDGRRSSLFRVRLRWAADRRSVSVGNANRQRDWRVCDWGHGRGSARTSERRLAFRRHRIAWRLHDRFIVQPANFGAGARRRR